MGSDPVQVQECQERLVQSLNAGLHLLDYLARKGRSVSLASIVRELEWDKSKTRRLLRTLLHQGFLDYDPLEKTYMLGGKIFELYHDLLGSIRGQAQFPHEFLEELAESIQENAYICVLRGHRVVVADVALRRHTGNSVVYIGGTAPAFCVATGKALLAQMRPDSAVEILRHSNIHALTPLTKTNIEDILKELEQVRAQGYATCEGEYALNLSGMAAPVFDSTHVVAALGIVFPGSPIPEDKRAQLVEALVLTARKMERRRGIVG